MTQPTNSARLAALHAEDAASLAELEQAQHYLDVAEREMTALRDAYASALRRRAAAIQVVDALFSGTTPITGESGNCEEPRQQSSGQNPIVVPPIDPEMVARELHARADFVKAELAKLEDAKRVSQETMQRQIGQQPSGQNNDPEPLPPLGGAVTETAGEGTCQFCKRYIGTGHESGCPYRKPAQGPNVREVPPLGGAVTERCPCGQEVVFGANAMEAPCPACGRDLLTLEPPKVKKPRKPRKPKAEKKVADEGGLVSPPAAPISPPDGFAPVQPVMVGTQDGILQRTREENSNGTSVPPDVALACSRHPGHLLIWRTAAGPCKIRHSSHAALAKEHKVPPEFHVDDLDRHVRKLLGNGLKVIVMEPEAPPFPGVEHAETATEYGPCEGGEGNAPEMEMTLGGKEQSLFPDSDGVPKKRTNMPTAASERR